MKRKERNRESVFCICLLREEGTSGEVFFGQLRPGSLNFRTGFAFLLNQPHVPELHVIRVE